MELLFGLFVVAVIVLLLNLVVFELAHLALPFLHIGYFQSLGLLILVATVYLTVRFIEYHFKA